MRPWATWCPAGAPVDLLGLEMHDIFLLLLISPAHRNEQIPQSMETKKLISLVPPHLSIPAAPVLRPCSVKLLGEGLIGSNHE